LTHEWRYFLHIDTKMWWCHKFY